MVKLGHFEETLSEFMRKGDADKVKWLKKLDKIILPSHVKRILQNDKTVLMEMVIPKWVDWALLTDWAQTKKNNTRATLCILCNNASTNGITFIEKHICESCFLKLKHLQ